MSTDSPPPTHSEERVARILRVIERVATRRLDGENVTDQSVIAEYEDLMPELEENLQALRTVEHARKVASDSTMLDLDRSTTDAAFAMEMGDIPSDTFHGYKVDCEVGRGAMGVVYKAVQATTGREVAIKVMMEGPFAGPNDRARFEREAQILGQLKHPNIVGVHNTGVASGRFYIVMDYIAGLPLDAHIARNGHSVRDKLQLFARICEVVGAAHLRGVIHRDLKPTNIRIDADGEPHVLDFGLAKTATDDDRVLDPAHSMTMTGQFVGSLPWASPEQAEGDPAKLDLRTDVYALGVIFYQMLTGQFPYRVVGNIRDVVDNIIKAEPTRPSTISARIDNDVETIVLKCLAKERERRYQSAIELARDVQHYLNGDPIEAKRDSSWYVLRKTLRRYRIPASVGAAFLVLLVAFGVTMSVMYRRAERQADRATRTLSFLQETLFEASSQRLGANATLVDALDEVAERVATDFAEQPDVAAAIHYTIGHAYDTLWKQEEAATHLRRARALYDQAYGPRHPETLKCAVLLGMVLGELRLPEAVDVQREALELRLKIYGDEHRLVAESMAELAYTLWIAATPRRWKEAEGYYCQALSMYRRALGPEHPDIARQKFAYGAMCLMQGRYTKAERLFRDSLRMSQRLLPEDHQFVTESKIGYADILQLLGRYDEAETLLNELIHVAPRRFGKVWLPVMLRRAGSLQLAKGDLDAAQQWYDRSIAEACDHLADTNPRDEGRMRALAAAFRAPSAADTSRDYIGALLAIHDLTGRPTETVETLQAFAALHTARSEHEDAERLLREALRILREERPNRRAYIASLSSALARCLLQQQRYQEVEPLLLDALPPLQHVLGPDHYLPRRVLQTIVELYDSWGKPDRAAEFRSMIPKSD